MIIHTRESDAVTERALSLPVAPCSRLVDDRDMRTARSVRILEFASTPEWNAHYLEVIRADHPVSRVTARTSPELRRTIHEESGCRVPRRERRQADQADRLDTENRAQFRKQTDEATGDSAAVRVALRRQSEIGRQTFCVSNPGSTCSSVRRLWTSSPAPTSSVRASATCAATSTRRRCLRRGPAVGRPPSSIAPFRSGGAADTAGGGRSGTWAAA